MEGRGPELRRGLRGRRVTREGERAPGPARTPAPASSVNAHKPTPVEALPGPLGEATTHSDHKSDTIYANVSSLLSRRLWSRALALKPLGVQGTHYEWPKGLKSSPNR